MALTADSPLSVPGASSNQALARGLHILRVLVDEGQPMTGTEIARRMGLHQSSVSRVLATLIEVGYARRSATGGFEPDYGVLALGSSTTRLPLITRPRRVFEELVAEGFGDLVSMCMLWRDEMIYLLRASPGSEPLAFWSGGFPLNVSVPALRLLVDRDEDEALAILGASRTRFGWGGRPEKVPGTEQELLSTARRMINDDVLILEEWIDVGHISGAIPVRTSEPHPVALAIVDQCGRTSPDRLTIQLHQARRRVEECFADPSA